MNSRWGGERIREIGRPEQWHGMFVELVVKSIVI